MKILVENTQIDSLPFLQSMNRDVFDDMGRLILNKITKVYKQQMSNGLEKSSYILVLNEVRKGLLTK
jgi:hypothetical protein